MCNGNEAALLESKNDKIIELLEKNHKLRLEMLEYKEAEIVAMEKAFNERSEKAEEIEKALKDLESKKEQLAVQEKEILISQQTVDEKKKTLLIEENMLNNKKKEILERQKAVDVAEIELAPQEKVMKERREKIESEEKEISRKINEIDTEMERQKKELSQLSEQEESIRTQKEKLEQMDKKIQQCYYGRDADGYKLLAKSKNFSQYSAHIGEDIFSYEVPAAVKGDSVQLLSKCPKKYMCFCTSPGEMVLSRTVYCEGSNVFRSLYFGHAFVIPSYYKEDYIRNIDRILYAKNFSNSYARAIDGEEISECRYIAYDEDGGKFSDLEQLLAALHTNKRVFNDILHAIFLSIGDSSNPVYIRLNCDAVKITDYALELLRFVMYCLPYELRRKFGFVTYLKTPQYVKNVNIIFVEDINHFSVRNVSVFDMKNENYPVMESLDMDGRDFTEFACDNLNNVERLSSFYEFAETYFESEGLEKSRKIADYGRLLQAFKSTK